MESIGPLQGTQVPLKFPMNILLSISHVVSERAGMERVWRFTYARPGFSEVLAGARRAAMHLNARSQAVD
jgi:hypothetical protein